MHAQLMRAARERAQFQHRCLTLRGIHHAIKRDSACALAIRDPGHAFAALSAKLGEWQVNAAFQRIRAYVDGMVQARVATPAGPTARVR
jgi:hypothetical protein